MINILINISYLYKNFNIKIFSNLWIIYKYNKRNQKLNNLSALNIYVSKMYKVEYLYPTKKILLLIFLWSI